MKKSGVMLTVVLSLLLGITGFGTSALADSYVQNVGEGSIN